MILLITLVILVILSTLGYTLCAEVAARRHREQFMIDYCIARHACASGLKYALASMNGLQFALISRPNEPDFSDVFAMTEPDYQEFLEMWAAKLAADSNLPEEGVLEEAPGRPAGGPTAGKGSRKKASLTGDGNDVNDINAPDATRRPQTRATRVKIRGPYGPPWPLVTEPVELEIGSAQVTVAIEDENAKYPLGWAILADEKVRAQAVVGWQSFCEWMGYTQTEIDSLNLDLSRMGNIKPFKTQFQPETEPVEPPASIRGRISRTPAASTAVRRTMSRKPVSAEEQMGRQNKEFAKLFHSALVNRDLLSRPSIVSDSRQECAMKYLGLWATRHVNVNTAPRHVLQAALTFGSVADAPRIADQIIEHRREKPVADVNELKQAVLRYATAIQDCGDFLTATSSVFSIRVTAVRGVARVTMLAAVSNEGDKVVPIAVISE